MRSRAALARSLLARARGERGHTLPGSGGKHVLVDGFEAEFVVAQAANRDGVQALRLAHLPRSGWISEMHRDLASV